VEIPGGAVWRVRVDQAGDHFHAASFFTVREGFVEEIVEYWVTQGSEEPPAWRARFGQRRSGPASRNGSPVDRQSWMCDQV
jgi:hypothetical protein